MVEIPRSLLITMDMAKRTPVGLKMTAADVDITAPGHCYLGLFILQDRLDPASSHRSGARSI